MKKIIFRTLKILIIIYCLAGIALYYLQDYFLFHPAALPADHKFSFTSRFEEIFIPMNDRETTHVVRFIPEGIRKGSVIYFHGNMKNVEYYQGQMDMFLTAGFEVWMHDYPGYGKSTGKRTEKTLYEQALQVYKLAVGKVGADSIVIYGKSLGTGLATYLAANAKSRALVLETPYYSIPSLFSSYAGIYPVRNMTNYRIPAGEYLENVNEPVFIFHGTSDDIIPLKEAKKLIPGMKPGDKFYRIEGGEHNDLAKYPEFIKVMDSVLSR